MSEPQSSANGLTIAAHFSPLSPKFGCAGFAELISLVITRTTADKVIIQSDIPDNHTHTWNNICIDISEEMLELSVCVAI